MDISEASKTFEALFPIVDTTTIYSPDIEAVVSGGVKNEGEYHPVLCADPGTAIRLWLEAAVAYKNQHEGDTLFWRLKPEMTEIVMHREAHDRPEGGFQPVNFYAVYSRLAVMKTP